MKIAYSLIILFVLIPSAFAAGLEVDDIRGFVDNERVSDVDEDGGDFDVNPGDVMDLVISIKNTDNQTIQAKLEGRLENINNGDDITKTQDFYDIAQGDARSKTLSFSIPSDTRNDIYDLELTIRFKYGNGTEGIVDEVRYDVSVRKSNEQATISNVDINGIIFNLTSSCNNIAKTTDTCFGYIEKSSTCSNELSTVKEERGKYQQQSEDCSSSIESIKSEKSQLESQKISLENEIDGMITHIQCNNQTAFAVASVRRESDDKFNQNLLLFGGGGLVYWYWQKRKKEKSSVSSSYQSDYYDKR